jgi:hypothetical protein
MSPSTPSPALWRSRLFRVPVGEDEAWRLKHEGKARHANNHAKHPGFISSTFSDLKAERGALEERVPAFESLLPAPGLELEEKAEG